MGFDKDAAHHCVSAPSHKAAHEFNENFSVMCGFISNASRQYFCIGENPKVSKNPSFPNLVFFS